MNFFLCSILLSIIVLLLFIKTFRQSRRLEEIRRVLSAMARGDLSSRISITPSDKLGDVARNVDELSGEIKKHILEITHEKEKLEGVLTSMAEGVLVISAQSRLVHLSPSFLDMFDVRSQEWQNKFYWEIISNQTINESIREAISLRSILKKEFVIVHPKEMFFDMLISPVEDSKGQLLSLVVVFHDVTELKKYERLRSEFVANVSHELKTPLTSIKGFVETLKEGAIDNRTHAMRFLDIIAKQTIRLENLVNDLLVLSSLESKEGVMNFTKESVSTVIQSVVLMKKKQIEDFRHELKVDVAANVPLIMMDTQRMEQVFLNLLDNAVKFSPPGSQITIKAGIDSKCVRIDVIDNGPGISKDHLGRLFERFFRVDKSRSQEKGGTGLGLSIVKHIIDAHQGKITVESTLGRGSVFTVFLLIDMI